MSDFSTIRAHDFQGLDSNVYGVPCMSAKGGYGFLVFFLIGIRVFHDDLFLDMAVRKKTSDIDPCQGTEHAFRVLAAQLNVFVASKAVALIERQIIHAKGSPVLYGQDLRGADRPVHDSLGRGVPLILVN